MEADRQLEQSEPKVPRNPQSNAQGRTRSVQPEAGGAAAERAQLPPDTAEGLPLTREAPALDQSAVARQASSREDSRSLRAILCLVLPSSQPPRSMAQAPALAGVREHL